MKKYQTARMKEWAVRSWGHRHLEGKVYGHPQFQDGELVQTSPLIYLNEKVGVGVTLNTIYILNEMDEDVAQRIVKEATA